MFGISPTQWKIVGLLILGNIGYYFYSNWGLVTVKVTDVPLSKVIRSIEWQGWVKIYTNLPLDTKVTMYADHVPLAEAMETLAANVDVPAPDPDDDNSARPNRDRSASAGNRPGSFAGFIPGGGGPNGAGAPGGAAGGRGGFGGRRAEWNLAFFVAPTAAEVQQEIREFQSNDPDDSSKIYTYGTQVQLIASDSLTTAPDPRLQAWPGVKPVDPSATQVPAPPAPPADGTPTAATTSQAGNDPVDPPANTPPTIQTYLQDFAQASNIWIMAPASWASEVSSAPPPNSSIIRAIENFVNGSHGAVTEAFVLRAGRGGSRGGAVAGGDDAWADRMRNAINGLPPDERADALEQVTQEVKFRKDLRALPPEQRRQRMIQHMMERMLYGERLSRLSPEKRAKVYQRMLSMRATAKAQK